MKSFSDLLLLQKTGDGKYLGQVEEGWQQGRGAFGGLVIALMAEALQRENTDERPLRSLQATLCGPVTTGSLEIDISFLRRGSGVTPLVAHLRQGNDVNAHAVGVFGKPREAKDGTWNDLKYPAPTHWSETEPVVGAEEMMPAFARFFEFRPLGYWPFSGGDERKAAGWIRLKEPGKIKGATYLAAMVDAWWPAVFAVLSAPRPTATLSYTLEILQDPETLSTEKPLYHCATSAASYDGYFSEARQLWSEDGRLLALNHQTMVLIK